MLPSTDAVVLCRVLVPLLGLVVWAFCYLNARCAYRLPKGAKRAITQLALVLGSIVIFVLQVQLMEHLTSEDAYGSYFFYFVLIECGGALAVLFGTLLHERARNTQLESQAESASGR
jgi:hypothetical protein